MAHFPIFLDLTDQPVLVVGGGDVAERKIRLLLRSGADIRVVSRALNETVSAWHEAGQVTWLARNYRPDQLDEARLAYGATDDPGLNRQVYRDAEARRIPVNVVDDREHCRFITPAIVDRAPLTVAISSGGASPVLARRLRAWLERSLPQGLGKVAQVAGQLRDRVAHWSIGRRRRAWDTVLDDRQVRRWSSLPQDEIRARMSGELERVGTAIFPGQVTLVGAGPGDPELLTLKALQALGQADVILHDRLVSADILDLARRDAEFIDVGKRAGEKHRTQDHIHRLMIEHATRGHHVVRLKGGDPFVFGRGGEELEVLSEAGIAFDVVPGITAATGCASSTGIPLTHRDHAQVLSLVTGHLAGDERAPDWADLAGPGRTVVVYMGLKQAGRIRQQLLDAGVPPDLPAALVANGTREDELVIHGTVTRLPAMAQQVPARAPTLMVLGEVTALGSALTGNLRRITDLAA